MDVQKTENKISPANIALSAVAGGLTAAAVDKMFLPPEVKAALKYSRLSEDQFVAKAQDAAAKTIEAFKKSECGSKIDIKQVGENAKNMYPEMIKCAKDAKKSFAKNFIWVAGAVAAGRTISYLLLKNQGMADKKEAN